MSRIIEAKAVISAEDRTGKAFDAIARKFKDVGKAAKVSAEVGKLAKQLDAAQAGLKNIDRFRSTQSSFNQARAAYRGTQVEVARIAKQLDAARKAASAFDGVKSFSKNGAMAAEMAAARKQVTELEKQFTATQRAVKASAHAYEAQAIAIKGAKREAEASGVSVGKLVAEQARLKAAVEGTSAAILKQASLERSGHSLTAGMGASGRQQADRIAAGRRLTDGMGAPARAERAARAREEHEARQAELRRRATASGDLITGMGGVGRRTAEHIDQGRRLSDGMGAPGRAAQAEREQRAMEAAEARAQRRSDRREAASALGAGAAIATSHKSKDYAKGSIAAAAEFDLAVRKQRVFTDISGDAQTDLMKQAQQIGQETQFSNIDVVKAQTAAMQGLPASFAPDLKAAVAKGIVGNVRNFSTLMETDLKDGTEIIRSYLQQSGKDISTKEKALTEANKATNQLVKMAKLGGMDGEDVKNFTNYGISAATSSGLSPEATMALGALARRGGLRGDVAGVAVRSMAGKIVSPTDKGLAALNAAGVKYSDFVHMPDSLSTDALEGQFKNKLGKGFTPEIRKKLDAINQNKELIGDSGKYTEAVTTAVGDILGKTKNGKVRASDSAKAAKAAFGFHKVSAQSVDAEGLLDAAFKAKMTLPQLNAWLTDKHGGKGAITQRQWEEYHASKAAIGHAADDPDWAKKKADEVFAGLGGAVENLKGSFENLSLWIGNLNAPLVKASADALGNGIDAATKLPEPIAQGITLGGFAAAQVAGIWGTLKLVKLALGLGGKAAAGGAGAAAAGNAGVGAAGAGAGAAGAAETGLGAAGAAGAAGVTLGAGGLIIAGGAVLGAGLDSATPGTNAGVGSLITGGESSLEQTNRFLAQERAAREAMRGTYAPDSLGDGRAKVLPDGGDASKGYASEYTTSRGVIGDFLLGREKGSQQLPGFGSGAGKTIPVEVVSLPAGTDRASEKKGVPPRTSSPTAPAATRPLVPGADGYPTFGAGTKTIPVEVVSLPPGADRSGQERAIGNTLDKAADASATMANGGKPIEATVKPDQITAKIETLPPVSGEATVTVDNHHQITVTLNTEMLDAKVNAAAGKAVARIPLSSSGARPGAVSMPGAASTPGAK